MNGNGGAADEWSVIKELLPEGWAEAARERGAFRRSRFLKEPGELLRLLLFHAVNDGGLRDTVQQARAAGIAEMSQVALLKRLRTSGDWLAWLGQGLCENLRQRGPTVPASLRPRVIDATGVQVPASKGSDWRIHYSLDLATLQCDWHEVTTAKGGEKLTRIPVEAGDVLLADRAYMSAKGVEHVVGGGGHVLVRLRWKHSWMLDQQGRKFHALKRASRLRVGAVGDWPVSLISDDAEPIAGRVIAVRLPRPVAEKSIRRAAKEARRRSRRVDPRTIKAASFVMVFTTLTPNDLGAAEVLDLYRCRWQIELAFKRLKQLLKLGRLPHKEPTAARSWILAKLVVALLLENLYRNAESFSPWGYSLRAA